MNSFWEVAFSNVSSLFFTLNQLCRVIVKENISRIRCVYQFHQFFYLFIHGNNIPSFQLSYELPRLLIQFLSQSFNIWQICWQDDNECLYRAIFLITLLGKKLLEKNTRLSSLKCYTFSKPSLFCYFRDRANPFCINTAYKNIINMQFTASEYLNSVGSSRGS